MTQQRKPPRGAKKLGKRRVQKRISKNGVENDKKEDRGKRTEKTPLVKERRREKPEED